MDERHIRNLVDSVKNGRLTRRAFINRLVQAGLTGTIAAQVMLNEGIAQTLGGFKYAPTRRGGGGQLKLLWWQAPTLLNPHFATGNKDQDACRIFYEPLASWDEEGNLLPVLAAEIPTKDNGGIAADGKSIIWRLKQGVQWHDGKPFTADDVVFNWEYARDPATAAVTSGVYRDVTVEKIDTHTIKVSFAQPTPFWANAFVGVAGMLIPKHIFAAHAGSGSRDAPNNFKPIGTGAYTFTDFRPGDLLRAAINQAYHVANTPHFDAIELKGGGDAVSAARAVIQTGEFDFAWNMLVEDELLRKMEQSGKGEAVVVAGGNLEFIGINFTDPNREIDGERSHLTTAHPALADKAVRQALNLLVDRASVEKHIYGRAGVATANFVNNPDRHKSRNTRFEFNIDQANALLDSAGWMRGADGIRTKGDAKLKWLFTTATNAPRQKTQSVIKQACLKAGIELELKSVVASVFFGADVANPDTYSKFYADIQMYTTAMAQPDAALFLHQFLGSDRASKANEWQGRNIIRYNNPAFDRTHAAAQTELDAVKRAALLIQCNDMVIEDVAVVPIVYRPWVHAKATSLNAPFSGWDSPLCQLPVWHRKA